MKATDTYIHLEGWIDEALQFEPQRQEESHYPLAEGPTPDENGVAAELRDLSGALLLRRACEIRYPKGCDPRPQRASVGLLRVAAPRHPEARELVLRHEGRSIFTAKIGEEPPTVGLELIAGAERDRVSFRLTVSDSAATLTFALIDESGRARAVQATGKGNTFSVALTPFAGLGPCRLRAQATLNCRTAQTMSAPFDTPEARLAGRIVSPVHGAELAPEMAFSLIGNLSIAQSGRALPWNAQLAHWVVDGVASERTGQYAAVDELAPGPHTIELRYGADRAKSSVLHKITVKVRERTSAEKEYKAALLRRDTEREKRPAPMHSSRPERSNRSGGAKKPGAHGPCNCH